MRVNTISDLTTSISSNLVLMQLNSGIVKHSIHNIILHYYKRGEILKDVTSFNIGALYTEVCSFNKTFSLNKATGFLKENIDECLEKSDNIDTPDDKEINIINYPPIEKVVEGIRIGSGRMVMTTDICPSDFIDMNSFLKNTREGDIIFNRFFVKKDSPFSLVIDTLTHSDTPLNVLYEKDDFVKSACDKYWEECISSSFLNERLSPIGFFLTDFTCKTHKVIVGVFKIDKAISLKESRVSNFKNTFLNLISRKKYLDKDIKIIDDELLEIFKQARTTQIQRYGTSLDLLPEMILAEFLGRVAMTADVAFKIDIRPKKLEIGYENKYLFYEEFKVPSIKRKEKVFFQGDSPVIEPTNYQLAATLISGMIKQKGNKGDSSKVTEGNISVNIDGNDTIVKFSMSQEVYFEKSLVNGEEVIETVRTYMPKMSQFNKTCKSVCLIDV